MATVGVEDEVETVPVVDDEDTYDINEILYLDIKDESHSEENDPFAQDVSAIRNLGGLSTAKKRSLTRMEKRFEGKDNAKTKQIELDIITGYNAFQTVLPPYNLDYLAKLYEKSPWHAAAVDAKVSNIVGLGYDFTPSPITRAKLDNVTGAPADKLQTKLNAQKQILSDLLDSLNEEDEFQEILTKIWTDFECTGNGYLEIARIDKGPNKGNIGYIGHIPSATMRVRRERDGFVQIISNHATFFRNFGGKTVDPIGGDSNPNEIIHFKKYSPSNTFYGVPDIVSASQAVAGNDFAAKFNLDYFENKAVPRHAIILKGATLNPRLAKNLLEFFETGIKGKNHRSIFIPLPADKDGQKVELSFEAIEAGTQDASFEKYKAGNVDEILAANHVPITKVSLAKNAALALARDADKTFKEQVCQPRQKVAEKKLNKVMKELTDLFLLKLNELTLTDAVTQANIDQMRRKTGTETANEQRLARGDTSHPDGDDLNNMIPVPNMDDAGPPPPVDPNAAAATAAAAKAPAKAPSKTPGGQGSGAARSLARAGNKTDTSGEGRNPKGEGRTNSAG